jgi:hypothetical protein
MRTMTILFAGLFALFMIGCGGGRIGFGDDGGADGSADGGIDVDQGDACPFCGVDSGGKDAGAYSCSGDLRNVIDGQGVVVQTCPDDQGCAGGVCVAACSAAAASKGSVGCDYVVPTPSFYTGIAPPCWAVFVANNWVKDVQITAARGGKTYNVTQFGRIAKAGTQASTWATVPSTGLPPNEVAVLFMSEDPSSVNGGPLACSKASFIGVTPAVSQQYGTALTGSGSNASLTGIGTAWHISTDLPVTMYDILPYGGASSYLPSAELLFPTSAWGTNYLGVVPQRGNSSPQWGQVVAMSDNTQITVFPNVSLPSGTIGGNVAAAPANQSTTYTLNAGQYIEWQEANEMSGTIISSNNPVGFFGGLGYDCYSDTTSTGGGCDSAHQQVPPVSAYGSEYAVPPYTTRRMDLAAESIRYRFVGAVNGTTLTYDPAVTGAPTTLKEGQVVDFETTLAFVVKAQDNNHPFFVGQVMTGCFVTSGSRPGCTSSSGCCLGDEEYVDILAPAQFLNKYVFFTDPTYPTTNLVVTRVKGPNGYEDVNIDCMTTPLTGWKNIDSAGKYQITNIDLIRGNTPNGKCNNGPHTASSNGAFGVMVWGLDYCSSYAYPAGGNIAPINTVILPPQIH